MIIVSGNHVGEPVGQIPGPNGTEVLVWSFKPIDLARAMMQAIGPIPEPSALGLGGHVERDQGDPCNGCAPQLVYNPAGDVANQAIASEYVALVSAWNQRAQSIQAMIMAMMKGA